MDQANQEFEALVFDAYGTLFDVDSVTGACEEVFPGRGEVLSRLWRAKQLQYTWLCSLMGRYQDFWRLTGRALTFACVALGLDPADATRGRLVEGYELAPVHLGIDAGRIGFVSSNSFDVIGAATYGFRSIWVNRSAAPLDQLGQPPQLTVANLAELVDAVNQDRR